VNQKGRRDLTSGEIEMDADSAIMQNLGEPRIGQMRCRSSRERRANKRRPGPEDCHFVVVGPGRAGAIPIAWMTSMSTDLMNEKAIAIKPLARSRWVGRLGSFEGDKVLQSRDRAISFGVTMSQCPSESQPCCVLRAGGFLPGGDRGG
jgi:hypothetical protein